MRLSSRENGFSLIELFVVMALIAIIAATALPAYRIYTQRAYNAVAESDLRNLVSLTIPASEQTDDSSNYLLFNQSGALPDPIGAMTLSEGIIAPFIYRWRFSFGPFDFDYTLVSVYHERGNSQYYFYDINGSQFRFQVARA